MTVKDIASTLEDWAPLSLQASYDNCGLLVGDPSQQVTQVIVSLDTTEAVVEEAIAKGAQMIVSHHPLIFKGLKQMTTNHWVERTVRRAVNNDIAIYALHTNLDQVRTGVNQKICEKLELENYRILAPSTNSLCKLVTFVPDSAVDRVREALFQAGVGNIGHYDRCSFISTGEGTFRPSVTAQPHFGSANKEERVKEKRLEVLMTKNQTAEVLAHLRSAHPYEEVAFYLTDLTNENQDVGAGMVGELNAPMQTDKFIEFLKDQMELPLIRHTKLFKTHVSRIAVCGGAGAFLLSRAVSTRADVLITSDFKYHDFFEANDEIILADIGHYESEIFTKELIREYLSKKMTNIAFHLSGVVTNPVHYS